MNADEFLQLAHEIDEIEGMNPLLFGEIMLVLMRHIDTKKS